MKQRQKPKLQPRVVVVKTPLEQMAIAVAETMKLATKARGSKKYDRARLLHSSTHVSTDQRAVDRRARRRARSRRRFLAGLSPTHPSEGRRRYRARKRSRDRRLAIRRKAA
jgi:hypothetical protein